MSDHILSGLRVIDCATYIAGPCAATVMSDFGAEVIKVERPGTGDQHRDLSFAPGMPQSEHNYCWIVDSRNKRSLTLDLKSDAGKKALKKLVATADVFITNYQPDLVEKFDISYESLKGVNPRLIYGYISGFGEAGPDAGKPAFDQTAFWARSGLMAMLHNADAEPAKAPTGLGDHPTGSSLFGAIMMALFNRERTGEGARVSTSLLANGLWSNSSFLQAELCGAKFYPKTTRKTSLNPLVNHYVTRDGKRLYMCCMDFPREWHAVCRVIEREDLIDDPRFNTYEAIRANSKELIGILEERFAQEPRDEWLRRLGQEPDLIFDRVQRIGDLPSDPAVRANDYLVEVDHPDYGRKLTPNHPVTFTKTPASVRRVAPDVGEHTAEVLKERLGYDDERLAQLAIAGVIA